MAWLVFVLEGSSSEIPATQRTDGDKGDKSEQHSPPPSESSTDKDTPGDVRARKEGLRPPFELDY